MVHRDLKPGNVLLRRKTGGVVLTDFGLARAGDTDGGAVLNAGTPRYMAPEQIGQRGNEIGPWTDMYALGCLAWSLLCGRPPFHRPTIDAVLLAHIHDPVPSFEPKTSVPAGVEEWLTKLLHKSPHQRYVRAADAAHALAKLAPIDDMDSIHFEPVFSICDEETKETAGVQESSADSMEDTQIMEPRVPRSQSTLPAPLLQIERSLLWAEREDVPPIPDSWHTEHPPRDVQHLLGTGLGMFGLRSFPVIGREAEQDQLWALLKQVRNEQCTRVVVIEGTDGMGKTHLSDWFARRSYEVGAAIVLRTQYRSADSADPLVGVLHSLLGTHELDREQCKERVEMALDVLGQYDEQEVEALLTVMGPFGGEQYSKEIMRERNEVRTTVIRRLLIRFSMLRPVIVIIDDAHLDDDARQFANTLLAPTTREHPVLCILNINSGLISTSYRDRIKDLRAHDRVDFIQLRPLATEHRSTLVRRMLGLAPELASLVERRSGGNPQFAVQLVGDWIQKDILVQGEDGFQLRKGIQPEFPADLQAVWERRLAAALPVHRDTRSLQLAAELGMDVDAEEWTAACSVLGIDADYTLVDAMIDSHLYVPQPRGKGWTFVHSLVRESLCRQAEFEGHRADHHRAAAEMLEGREGVAARRGRHLYNAGEVETSLPLLREGAEQCAREGRNEVGWDLITVYERALKALKVPKTDLRWAEGWLVKERFVAHRKDFPAVLQIVDDVLEKTKNTANSQGLRAKAWFRKGTILRLMSETDAARTCLNKAMELAVDDPTLTCNALDQMGTLELNYGNPALSLGFFEGALEAAEQANDLDMLYRVRANMAGVYRREGDIQTARGHLSAAMAHHRDTGSKAAQSRCLNDMAELDRFVGDTEKAEEGYRLALKLLEALGDQRFYVAGLNLGIIYAETNRPVEARSQLEQCRRALQSSGLAGIEGVTSLCLAHVYVQLGSIEDWRVCFEEGTKLIEETGFVDVDIARSAQKGGEELLAGGYLEEARTSLEFARDHWEQLERDVEAAELTDIIDELGQ
jgi:tetratricopeptide (TPR) repeat protein